jgi:hypothetical protein
MQEPIAIRHNVVMVGPFSSANIAAEASDLAAALPGGNTNMPMPYGGSVVGMVGKLSAAATAGALTVGVTVDGTEDADSVQSIATETEFTATFQEGEVPFAVDENLGVELNTNAAWDGTTADIDVFLLVLLRDMEF